MSAAENAAVLLLQLLLGPDIDQTRRSVPPSSRASTLEPRDRRRVAGALTM
jgi:hypothetical protein